MASKTINTILNLKDKMSGGIVGVSNKVKGMSKEAQRANKQVANMANNIKKKADEMSSKASKLGATFAGLGAALGIKTGIGEALDLEGYRLQLETATKDTKKAGEIMKYAIDLANKTPFEGGELVQGASKLEAMGLSAQKWLPLIGDIAAATNKPFDQAIEAFIDSQTGELERLKEFGVTKAKIAEKANKMFAGKQVINNKGQIVDFEKFNAAMVKVMEERFTGGMEKQSSTVKGVWSTVTGVTKSSLAEMVGMTSDGTIKQGSLLDKLKEKVTQLADRFSKWQQDGTIQRASQAFTDGFTKMYNIISTVVNFILEHQKTFETLAVTIAGFMIAVKVATAIKTAMVGLQIVWALFNGTLALTPLGWVVIGITALIAAGYALWRNWDKVSAALVKAWDVIKAGFSSGVNWVIQKLNWLIEKMNKIPGVNIPLIAEVGYRTSEDNKKYSLAVQKSQNLDTYADGGIANKPSIFAEAGPEAAIPLKKTPRSIGLLKQTANALGVGGNISVYVTIQGNVIGNEEYADYVGNIIVNKVKLALANM
jgi:hypothetical protein